MKEIAISLWEITKEEAQKLEDYTEVLIHDSLTGCNSIEYANKKAIFNSKYCSHKLIFFTFNKPKFKE